MKYNEECDCKFLQYTETHSKNHQGGTKDFNCKPKVVTVYANQVNPNCCVVSLYEKYVALCPSHDPKCSHNLYLHPLKCYSEHMWYSCQLLGINTLQQVSSKLANCANLNGKQTNHSLHATGPTRLYSTGMDDKLVRELTEHHSNAVLEYKHTPIELKQHVSEVLYGNEDTHMPKAKKSSSIVSKVENCSQQLSQSQVVESQNCSSQSYQSLQSTPVFNVNYNVPKDSGLPQINVYPIINVLQGLNPGMPVIINVNLQLDKSWESKWTFSHVDCDSLCLLV